MRYEIHTGKFGCYFYDVEQNKDVTLKEAVDIMNFTSQKIQNFNKLKDELLKALDEIERWKTASGLMDSRELLERYSRI